MNKISKGYIMFQISRKRVISLGLLSAVSFSTMFSVSQVFADTQYHSTPVGHHFHWQNIFAHRTDTEKTSQPVKYVHETFLNPDDKKLSSSGSSITPTSTINELAKEKAIEFRKLYNTQLATCPAGTNNHGGCTQAQAFFIKRLKVEQ